MEVLRPEDDDAGFALMCGLPEEGATDWAQAFADAEDDMDNFAVSTPPTPLCATEPIARISAADVTPAEFQHLFLQPCVPCVITDPHNEWVPGHLTTEYFRERHGHRALPLDVNARTQRVVPLRTFLDFADAEMNRQYLRNLQMAEMFPGEAAALRLPGLFGENLLACEGRTPNLPPTWRRWFELFICTRQSAGFPFLHQDTCGVHACTFQTQGRKQYTLMKPTDSPYLYPSGPSGTRSQVPAVDIIQGTVDLDKFPLYSHATPVQVEVGPGEMLFIPSKWWHTARCVGPDPSVTIIASFVDEALHDEFCDNYWDYQAVRSLVSHGAGKIIG